MTTITNWLSGRIGRTGIRRWFILAGMGLCIILLHHSYSSSRTSANDLLQRIGLPQEELPKVDRSALDKLRLLEIHNGADEDEEEQDFDGSDDGDGYEQSSRSRGARGRKAAAILDRPPTVAEIPEPDKPNPLAPPRLDKIPAEILDQQVCGATHGHGCQFLVPAWLGKHSPFRITVIPTYSLECYAGEQETKAQQHLYQLGLLALSLNRTLVLPNVSKSRLGTCYRHPFSFYYSPSSLSSLGIPTISQEDFLLWTQQRDPPPSAQVVSMVNAKPGLYPQGAVEIDSSSDPFTIPSKPTRNLCLRSPRSKLDFNTHSPLAIYPPEGYHKSENGRLGFGQSVINTLLSSEVGSKSSRASSSKHFDYSLPDVLAFNYEMRFPIMSPSSLSLSSSSPDSPSPLEPLPFTHFPYAQIWSDLADEISTSLSPFISIHWRTETLTPSNLLPCSQSLLQKILSLKRKHPEIKNVYLATDYPIEQLDPSLGGGGGEGEDGEGVLVAHSGTFAKVVTESHHRAMRKFLKDFDKLSKGGLRLTTFAKEQSKISSLDTTTSRLPPSLISELTNLTLSSSSPSLDESDSPPRLNLGLLDSGLLGILDKLIVTKSQLFLTGVPGVGSSTVGACAKLSSFTNQLISAREGLMEAQQEGREGVEDEEEREKGEGELWNTVMHWSLNGEDVD